MVIKEKKEINLKIVIPSYYSMGKIERVKQNIYPCMPLMRTLYSSSFAVLTVSK